MTCDISLLTISPLERYISAHINVDRPLSLMEREDRISLGTVPTHSLHRSPRTKNASSALQLCCVGWTLARNPVERKFENHTQIGKLLKIRSLVGGLWSQDLFC
jgi:hypothetical protein